MYLFRATKDPHYIALGRDVLTSLETRCRVSCGYASSADVESRELVDRMDSYFLSETTKYLYLLFSPDHYIHNGSFILTTEGHLLPITTDPADPALGYCSAPTFAQTLVTEGFDTMNDHVRPHWYFCVRFRLTISFAGLSRVL